MARSTSQCEEQGCLPTERKVHELEIAIQDRTAKLRTWNAYR